MKICHIHVVSVVNNIQCNHNGLTHTQQQRFKQKKGLLQNSKDLQQPFSIV